MTDREGRYLLSFNGEIFNFMELRAELEASGISFTTSGDTEVLLHALITWGIRALPRLRGQFAIAFWDSRERTLLLARDRFGIVPLFWTGASSKVVFASQVRALKLVEPTVGLSINDVVDAGVLWGLHPERSCFSDVNSVTPGGYVLVRSDGVRQSRYWELEFDRARHAGSIDEQALELSEKLRTAVVRRIPAYGSPAVLLSGGLDSSAILGLLRDIDDESAISSFSIRFESEALDEDRYQQLAARTFATKHGGIICDDEAVATALVESVESAESPLARTAPAATIRLAAFIKASGVRTVLSGEGADELLCGYDLFKITNLRSQWPIDSAMDSAALEAVLALQKELGRDIKPAYFERGTDDVGGLLFSHITRWATSHRITQYLVEELRGQFTLNRILAGVQRRFPEAASAWTAIERAQFLESRYFLAHSLLANQCDRPYMSHGVEGRYPFLDEDVVDFALTLPEKSKLDGTNEKFVLKRAMEGVVPTEIVQRVKQPYTAPEGDIFRTNVGEEVISAYASPTALRSVGLFDEKRVAWLVSKLRRGRTSFHDDLALLWIVSTQILGMQFGVSDVSPNDATAQMIGAMHG